MKTTNNTNSVRFTIDFIKKEIIGTKASFDKASKGVGEAYDELAAKIAAHPTFALKVKEQKNAIRREKRTYEGMDFDFMEKYIAIQKKASVIMAEYNSVKKCAKDNGISIYPFVKKWFLGEFDPDGRGFDMASAKQEIIDRMRDNAVLNTPLPQPAEVAENADLKEVA